MDNRGFIGRRGFWPLAWLWLPAGVLASAAVRFGPDADRMQDPGPWLASVLKMAGSLALVAPCGLPKALGCRRVWRLGYRWGACAVGTALGAVAAGASLVAGVFSPVAIAVYAVVLSVPVWIAWWWLARPG